jgi:hypothetical protein
MRFRRYFNAIDKLIALIYCGFDVVKNNEKRGIIIAELLMSQEKRRYPPIFGFKKNKYLCAFKN